MQIAPVCERLQRLQRLQIQFGISRSFDNQNPANLGSKIRFWIRRKEHTVREIDQTSGVVNLVLLLETVFF